MRKGIPPPPYQIPPKPVRPPLIPNEDEYEQAEEGLFGSMGKLFLNTGSSMVEVFKGRKKPRQNHIQQHYHQPTKHSNAWPVQESYVIPDEDEPPSLETRTPPKRKNYPFVTNEMENSRHQLKQNRSFQGGWNGSVHHHQQHHQRHYSTGPETYYEQSCEKNEVVFGAVQEQDGRRGAVVIKALDYGDPIYNSHNIRSRYNYTGYSYGY